MFQQKKKTISRKENATFKRYRNNSGNVDLQGCFKYIYASLNALLEAAKEKYYHNAVNKLNNTQKNSKAYWYLSKVLLNSKKIPIIPPIVLRKSLCNRFQKKADLFHSLFSKQCSLILNNSSLPSDVRYLTGKRLLHFQQKILGKLLKISIQTKYWHAKNML